MTDKSVVKKPKVPLVARFLHVKADMAKFFSWFMRSKDMLILAVIFASGMTASLIYTPNPLNFAASFFGWLIVLLLRLGLEEKP